MQGSGGKCMSIQALDHYIGKTTSSIQQDFFFQAKLLMSVMKISGSSLCGRHILIGSKSPWKNHALRTSSSPGCLTGATRYSQISRLALSLTTSRQPSKHSFDFHTSSVLQKQFGLHTIARKLPISANQRLHIGRHPTASIIVIQPSSSLSTIYRPPPDSQCKLKPTSSSFVSLSASEQVVIFVFELLLYFIVMIIIFGYSSFDSDDGIGVLHITEIELEIINDVLRDAAILQFFVFQERHLNSGSIDVQTCPCWICETGKQFVVHGPLSAQDHFLEQHRMTLDTFPDRYEHDFRFDNSAKRKVSVAAGGTIDIEVRWNSKKIEGLKIFQTLIHWGGKTCMWFFLPVPDENSESGLAFHFLGKLPEEADA